MCSLKCFPRFTVSCEQSCRSTPGESTIPELPNRVTHYDVTNGVNNSKPFFC